MSAARERHRITGLENEWDPENSDAPPCQTIARIGSISIRIYYDDHGVPHFHAISPDFDFKIAIGACTIISGTGQTRGRDLAVVRTWGQRHRDVLYLNWQLAREGKPLQDIEN